MDEARRTLASGPYASRIILRREHSLSAAKTFADRSLSFIHLDARDDRGGTLDELRAWWPKLCDGGILAGTAGGDSGGIVAASGAVLPAERGATAAFAAAAAGWPFEAR